MLAQTRPTQALACNARQHCRHPIAQRFSVRSQRPCRLSRRHRGSFGVCCAGLVTEVNAEELQTALDARSQKNIPMVLDFYANWCGPCLLLAKELEKVAEHFGDKLQILKIDTDKNTDLSTQLRIEGLPTMVFVSPDQAKPAIRTEGLLPADTIIKIITDELTSLPSVEIPPEPTQS